MGTGEDSTGEPNRVSGRVFRIHPTPHGVRLARRSLGVFDGILSKLNSELQRTCEVNQCCRKRIALHDDIPARDCKVENDFDTRAAAQTSNFRFVDDQKLNRSGYLFSEFAFTDIQVETRVDGWGLTAKS